MDADAISQVEIIDLITASILGPRSGSRDKDDANDKAESFYEGYHLVWFYSRFLGSMRFGAGVS